ncbi:hypothetical protein [Neptuniibacter sp. QD37_11]|uniref:hypothetical protein n=1 Tax=Neptuniibacter sp. QD37_11 TaxID=3398209 RepID=UPI0039F5808E
MALSKELLEIARKPLENPEKAKQRLFKQLDEDAIRFKDRSARYRPTLKQLKQRCGNL